ncbi:MAG: hypothetical protein CL843_16270 [Crocinitomicaceae bacterium]|nr:hypothetical protein [Crocinitomicaceae bacterium]|tara:strand:- start:12109 stop:12291 length:183 start_codon:yes stop_codon:yes gene_type:complete
MTNLTAEQIRKINMAAISRVVNCHPDYVSKVLHGKRNTNTDLAKRILSKAKQMVEILEGE